MSSTVSRPLNVFVTGATSGIGLATALELSRRGHRVVGSARSAEKGENLLAQARGAGLALDYVELEVADADSCGQAMRQVVERFEGKLSALVNNAGVAFGGAMQDLDDSRLREQFEVNVFGPLRIARLAVEAMRPNGAGTVVNVSSFVSRFPVPFLGAYSASKRALDAAGDAMRLECAAMGIRVISVQPGVFDSSIWDRESADISKIEHSWYAASYQRLHPRIALVHRISGPAPVARKLARILERRRPGSRYLVGVDARAALALETVLPRAVLDWAKRWSAGLSSSATGGHRLKMLEEGVGVDPYASRDKLSND